MEKIEIVADRAVADAIEKLGQSGVLRKDRSFHVGETAHFNGYSTVEIIANEQTIKPEDIFWLGWFSKGIEQGII